MALPPLKWLERRWRRLWIRVLTAVVARRGRGAGAGGTTRWDDVPRSVLVLRYDRIGDMVVTTGLLHTLATARPTLAVDVLASPANAPVLEGQPGVRRVWIFRRDRPWSWPALVRRLRRARYDAVVDPMVTAPSLTTLLLMLASGARERVGAAGRGNDAALTIPVVVPPTATHMAERLAALAAAFGVEPAAIDARPRLWLAAAERAAAERLWAEVAPDPGALRLLVNVSAGKAARAWPAERYVALLREVRRHGEGVVPLVIGDPRDAERVQAIARDADVRVARTRSIREAFALVATAHALFSPDTGIAHAASAFGTPSVAMFVRGMAGGWGRFGTLGHDLASADATLRTLPLGAALYALFDLLATRVWQDALAATRTDGPLPAR